MQVVCENQNNKTSFSFVLFMRVAMVGWEYPPFMSGGLGVHCENLSRNLVAEGAEVDFFLPENACRFDAGGVRLVPVRYAEAQARMGSGFVDPYRYVRREMSLVESKRDALKLLKKRNRRKVDAYNVRLAKKIRALHKKKHYDLVHVHGRFNISSGVLVQQLAGIPFVWTVHSTIFDEAAEQSPDSLQYAIEKVGADCADRVIAVSKRTKKQLVKRFGARARKVSVVYNGINYADFAVEKPRRKKRSRVLFHGRLTNQKGPRYFLLAARQYLKKYGCTARFTMSGKGHLTDYLKRLARDTHIASRVSFPGFIPQEKLAGFYASHDAFVLPSVSEPFGITVLEAMAAGTPAVISNTCGVGEIVHNCLRTDYWNAERIADQVHALLSDDGLYEELSWRGREEVRKWSWDRIARDTLKVYGAVSK